MKQWWLAVGALFLILSTFEVEAAVANQVNISLQDVIETVEKTVTIDKSTGQPFLTTVTADFFQRSTLAEQKRELKAEGEMSVKWGGTASPLMFRFDYFRPTTQEILSNGQTLWMYLPENRQVIVSDVSFVFNPSGFNAERDRAVNFLQGLGRISKDFLITFSPQRQDISGNYILELSPRRASVMMGKLFIVVARDAVTRYVGNGRRLVFDPVSPELAFPILSSTVIDPKGNMTTMEFTNIKANIWLSDGLFNFIMPAGVEVVRPPTGH